MKYEIEEQVLKETLAYLNNQPFGEVANLIAILRNSKQIQEKKDTVKTTESKEVPKNNPKTPEGKQNGNE